MESALAWVLMAVSTGCLLFLVWQGTRRRPFNPNYIGDAANQLRIVMKADFRAVPVLSKGEYRVFRQIETLLQSGKKGLRIVPQICLGEIIQTDDKRAYHSINAKRVDMLVISPAGLPLVAIEHQGPGHYTESAAARDAVKKEALRRAGISYVEFFDDDPPAEIERRCVAALAARLRQPDKSGPWASRSTAVAMQPAGSSPDS